MYQNQPFFTVIMPVYGVEQYLEKCTRCVLNQTYKNLELILVNDASPDASPEICDEIAKKDSRVTVIHKSENEGLSMARNTGIEYISSRKNADFKGLEYICFFDSDDEIDETLFETVADKINQDKTNNKPDVILFGLVEEYYYKNKLSHTKAISPGDLNLKTKEDINKNILNLEEQTLLGYAWNKCYSLDLIKKHNLRFEKVTLIEDILFNAQAFEQANSALLIDITPYKYKKRLNKSLTNKFVPDYFDLHRRRIEILYNFHKNNNLLNEDIKKRLGNIFTRYIFSAIQRNYDKRAGFNRAKRRAFVKNLFDDELFNNLINFAKPDNKFLKIMANALKKRRVFVCVTLGHIIHMTKRFMPGVFDKNKNL